MNLFFVLTIAGMLQVSDSFMMPNEARKQMSLNSAPEDSMALPIRHHKQEDLLEENKP